MEMEIIKLMENIGVIPQNVSQYMQSQAFVPPVANNPNATSQQVPTIPQSGVFPGSNPMDLLQLQQLQQFYQMQQMQAQKKWSILLVQNIYKSLLNPIYAKKLWIDIFWNSFWRNS